MLKTNKLLLIVTFFLAFSMLSYAADDQYKPYLHKPSVPEHPKAKLYGKYTTNLFPGAATYEYPIEVPKGTNNLQPSLSISYNSQAVKQRPSILGAGWSITQNYIYRDVNFTPSNITDDEFKLILNGASYDLIYDNSDGFYHTEIETFARVQNISTTSNTYKTYWIATLKDGTQLRFGYNTDSELTSNVGYSYALKWSLDQIEDTHNNKIFYSYSENHYPQDNGSVYLSQILYNNEQKRRVEFGYESSVRPDRRRVYEQGNVLEESRRLSDISVLFNDTLVRRYNFEYISLNNESSLSSLSKIKYIGSDNSSVLHTITLDYYQSTSFYTNSTTYNVSEVFSNSAGTDLGLRLIDLNNDGYIDIIKGSGTSNKKAWLNNKTGWNESPSFNPPEDFTDGSNFDKGLRIADLNNDGFADLIQGYGGVRKAWLNNITGWREDSLTWAPSIDFVASNVDEGAQLADFNGDGKVDLLQAKDGSAKKAYLNTGSGWKDVSSQWASPTYFVKSDGSDFGSRLVDLNGDGLVDVIEGYNFGTETKNAWLNNGSGWVSSSVWNPPDVFTSSSRVDNGIRLIDLNGDGLTDILQDYKNGSTTEREAFINNGNGWSNSTSWNSPEPFTQDGKNIGRRIGDINGDGFGDIVIGYNDGTSDIKRTLVRNATIPYLLKNITNEFGGITYLDYEKSTLFNNTGNGSSSDIGFNVWVVKAFYQNNSLYNDFNIFSNTSYSYFGGKYDYDDAEFRGFNIVNETLADKSVISHYFHQNKQLKGKEFKTETYDRNGNIFSKTENNFNFTTRNNNVTYFIINLLSTASYTHDGQLNSPKITNISYTYDNYSNLISKTLHGDVSILGDEKYENYTFAYNTTAWILDKVSWYLLFDSSNNKIRESKYFYDNHQYGDPPSKGDLTKVENYLDTGGGNPTTYYQYDDFGNLYRETDALGRTIIREYGIRDETNTYPDRITNALVHAIDYTYDVGTGNIISYKKYGVDFLYEYDTFGRITKDIDPYDTTDFPTKKYEYLFDGIAPEIIKVSQRTTSNNTIDIYYVYDGFANLVQIKTPGDGSITNLNQKRAALICSTAGCTNAQKDVPYKNNLTAMGYKVTTIIDTNQSWDTSQYDVVVVSESITNTRVAWLGNTTSVGILTMESLNFDEFGFGTSSDGSTSTENDLIVINASHPITSGFSGSVNVTSIESNTGSISGWSNDVKALVTYSGSANDAKILAVEKNGVLVGGNTAAGRRVYFGQANGNNLNRNGTQLWRNAVEWAAEQPFSNDQVVKNLFYDGLFRVKEEQNPYFAEFSINLTNFSNTANKTKYNYDALSRITSVINPDGTLKNTTYNKWEINDYDENNNLHTYLLDAYDRIIAVTEYNTDFYLLDNETYNTTYTYSGADELAGIRDTYGNEFNFSYDSLGRKIKLKDPDLGTWSYSYDLAGNLVNQLDNKGNSIKLSYDGLNRILQKNTSSQIFAFTYDKQYQGTLSNLSYDNITFTYTYDDRLRNTKEVLKIRKFSFETGLTYDSMNRILETRLPDSDDFDYYYALNGKLDKVRGYINQTKYNPLGNPLNRSYFNSKISTFDYYPDHLRLRQIKTDNIQQLNYTYYNVGNVKSINDSINNRSYVMDYDKLDRLTNVSINSFTWVYSYDAIGNILKIVRNSSETTSLKYGIGLAHFPYKIITTQAGVDTYRQSNFNNSNKTKIVQFYLVNERNASITNVNWSAEFGDFSLIDSNIPFNLSLKENVLVIVEHNYSRGGNYIINVTSRSGASFDYERLNLIFGAVANSLNILKKNASTIVTEFNAKNTINELSVNWTWNCSNGIQSSVPFNMSANEELLVVMENNYSLSNPNLTCAVYSADGNQSKFTAILFDRIKIEEYNSTTLDSDTILIKFQIRNYFATLTDINWNITADGSVYKSSGISLNQGQSTTITQELNFTTAGLKQIKITIGSGNFTDSYTENVKLYSLGIREFFDYVKNGTTRIFNFLVKNDWTNLTARFNITNPALENSTTLSQNESLIVVIEEDYSQGNKQVDIKVFNQTLQEESLIEVFRIRQISIENLQALFETDRRAVISSFVKNNINPLNLSWRLNNTEQLINSTLSLQLNTSEQVIVVIENNFSTSGIYPLTFLVNSSTYNDNATGVAVS